MKKLKFIMFAAALIACGAVLVFVKTAYIVPVLMYHSIDNNYKASKLSVSPESFKRQMEFLHNNGYNVISLEKIAYYLKNKVKIPPKTVSITFDDGFLNNYEVAYPVLKKYGIPAAIFVIVDKVGEHGYLGWKEIKEMSDSGLITIGSHTLSHRWLPYMGTEQLRSELSESKRILEENIGKPVRALCYPYGSKNDRVEREARLAGYACAAAIGPGPYSPFDDVYSIKRIKISRTSDNMFAFWFEVSGYYTWIKERDKKYQAYTDN